jgi:hypothetical protein
MSRRLLRKHSRKAWEVWYEQGVFSDTIARVQWKAYQSISWINTDAVCANPLAKHQTVQILNLLLQKYPPDGKCT